MVVLGAELEHDERGQRVAFGIRSLALTLSLVSLGVAAWASARNKRCAVLLPTHETHI